jgi:hypothetical protein
MEKRWIWGWIVVMVLFFAGCFLIQTSRGYHLEWSGGNGSFIWVDAEGKP